MTKQNNQDLPLRDAFPPMPADCYDALMRAARSAEEETNMSKRKIRASALPKELPVSVAFA